MRLTRARVHRRRRGLAGQRITTSEFDQNGFLRDRRYMVVRVEADGPVRGCAIRGSPLSPPRLTHTSPPHVTVQCTFQHQRVLPQMAAMSAEYTDNGESVLLWLHRVASEY